MHIDICACISHIRIPYWRVNDLHVNAVVPRVRVKVMGIASDWIQSTLHVLNMDLNARHVHHCHR